MTNEAGLRVDLFSKAPFTRASFTFPFLGPCNPCSACSPSFLFHLHDGTLHFQILTSNRTVRARLWIHTSSLVVSALPGIQASTNQSLSMMLTKVSSEYFHPLVFSTRGNSPSSLMPTFERQLWVVMIWSMLEEASYIEEAWKGK